MECLHFEYHMEIHYNDNVGKCHFTIKCIPMETLRQHLLDMDIGISPETKYSFGTDSFGNRQIYGKITDSHRKFVFDITGDVEIHTSDAEEYADASQIGMYRYPFGKCGACQEFRNYLDNLRLSEGNSDYEKCFAIMRRLHEDFEYNPGATGIYTTAEEAWAIRKGVCQDYAHIFIALLRMSGIPARYICGLIAGEGASHAWVEAFCNGKWIGFDPTNNCPAAGRYIKLGNGRDASDCAINRGIMWGGGAQTHIIRACVQKK